MLNLETMHVLAPHHELCTCVHVCVCVCRRDAMCEAFDNNNGLCRLHTAECYAGTTGLRTLAGASVYRKVSTINESACAADLGELPGWICQDTALILQVIEEFSDVCACAAACD